MEPETVVGWAQVGLYASGTVLIIVMAVGQLFRSMGSTYALIISALQHQNADQERRLAASEEREQTNEQRIDSLNHRLVESDRECDETIASLTKRIEDVERGKNGG
jgi:uncharacterized coiled-coil protein SlyX